jgi:hypothetical protein
MQNNVINFLLWDYMDIFPINGVLIIDSMKIPIEKRGDDENQQASLNDTL